MAQPKAEATDSLAPVLRRYRDLPDMTSAIADVLDDLGVNGAVPASRLKPLTAGARIVGPAFTIRNLPEKWTAHRNALHRETRMIMGAAVHSTTHQGDVLVIQGLPEVSSLGGHSALAGKERGEAGAIVDGGIRDVASIRESGYAVWSAEITPITGRWRLDSVEVNGAVTIAGIQVRPGDVVAADDTGVCFIPKELAEDVLARCEAVTARDASGHPAR